MLAMTSVSNGERGSRRAIAPATCGAPGVSGGPERRRNGASGSGSSVEITCTSIGPGRADHAVDHRAAGELDPARPAAGTKDELGGVLRPCELDRAPCRRRRRRSRGTCRRPRSSSARCSSRSCFGGPASPSVERTCTPNSSAWAAHRHARGAPDEQRRRRARPVMRDDDALAGLPRPLDAVRLHVVLERVVDLVGHPEQCELPERGEVAGAEVVGERGVDPLRRVDVAVRHATADRLGRHVDQLDLLGGADDGVRDGLVLLDAGDPLDHVVDRLEVLHVQRRDDVDAGVEQLVDVLPPLLVARPGTFVWAISSTKRELRACGRGWRRRPSPRTRVPRYEIFFRGTTSRSRICASVLARPCVSTNPTTTSLPRCKPRQPSLSMAKVLPTPGAAPKVDAELSASHGESLILGF